MNKKIIADRRKFVSPEINKHCTFKGNIKIKCLSLHSSRSNTKQE